MTRWIGDVGCAHMPAAELPVLADLREVAAIEVVLTGDRAWVCWEPPNESVLRRLLPVAGVRLYIRREGRWYERDNHLPAFEVPATLDYRPLHQVLTPAAAVPLPVSAPPMPRVPIRLSADDRPRRATAVRCGLEALARWADTVSAFRLASIQAACCEGLVLLRGERLPLLPAGQRYWGESVLAPLGFCPQPNLPARALREALAIDNAEILLLEPQRVEAILEAAFRPLTRAGIRLAIPEA